MYFASYGKSVNFINTKKIYESLEHISLMYFNEGLLIKISFLDQAARSLGND